MVLEALFPFGSGLRNMFPVGNIEQVADLRWFEVLMVDHVGEYAISFIDGLNHLRPMRSGHPRPNSLQKPYKRLSY